MSASSTCGCGSEYETDCGSYRLNVFGFPAAAGALGNPGLTDIRLAVEWVKDNIEGFGCVDTTLPEGLEKS